MHEISGRVGALTWLIIRLAAISAPAAANATGSWGPLTLRVDGRLAGDTTGVASVTSVHIKNAARWKGSNENPTRVETTWAFYESLRQADGTYINEWDNEGRSDTAIQSQTSYKSQTVMFTLDEEWSHVRAKPRLCSPRPWGTPVPCSVTAIKTFSY